MTLSFEAFWMLAAIFWAILANAHRDQPLLRTMYGTVALLCFIGSCLLHGGWVR